jgi:hypothetical protein
MRGVAALLISLAACAEPAIEMRLELPPADKLDRFNVSCVGAVEVFVRGADRGTPDGPSGPGRDPDDEYACLPVEGVDSYAAVRRAIAGRFDVAIPDSGLAGVDVRGSTGSCNKETAPGDTIFYATAAYDGGDELVLPMSPNLSCNVKRTEVVRPVDLLALTRTRMCPPSPTDNAGGVDSATIHPFELRDSYLDFNNDFAGLVGGVATVPLYLSTDDPGCVAIAYGDLTGTMTAANCARRGNGVCSAPGQIELPIISYTAGYQNINVPATEQYGGWVIGGVWGQDGTNKVPLAGATVQPAKPADASRIKVVYAEYPANAASPVELPTATATNSSGLFIAYVGRPADFIVSAPGYRPETVRLGSPGEPATSLILLAR